MGQRYGRVVFVTSPAGHVGFQGQTNYGASKAGQVGMARSLCKEVAARGITVNCVSPGFIDTELIGDLPDDLRKEYRKSVPSRRFGKPEEVASAILFLASREAAYVNGATLEVTGGLDPAALPAPADFPHAEPFLLVSVLAAGDGEVTTAWDVPEDLDILAAPGTPSSPASICRSTPSRARRSPSTWATTTATTRTRS